MSVKLREGERLIEDFPLCSIIEIGGPVHYSLEFRVYLMGLPPEQRQRIVCEIEERARVRSLPLASRFLTDMKNG